MWGPILTAPAPHPAADQLAELVDVRIADRVDGAGALLGAAHHPGLVKDPEVLGDVLLGRAECLLELGHARVPFVQAVQQLDPHRLPEHAETLGHELHKWPGHRMWRPGDVTHTTTQ